MQIPRKNSGDFYFNNSKISFYDCFEHSHLPESLLLGCDKLSGNRESLLRGCNRLSGNRESFLQGAGNFPEKDLNYQSYKGKCLYCENSPPLEGWRKF